MELQLRLSGFHHEILKQHLFPADGSEAVAVALCGRFSDRGSEFLLIHDLKLIPYSECICQEPDLLQWRTNSIEPYFELIGKSDLALLKIHSHPGGFGSFSKTDDVSDHEFFDSAFGWSLNDKPHASAIMLPGGRIFGRFFYSDLHSQVIDKIIISGDTILQFSNSEVKVKEGFALRTIQAFGDGTYQCLKGLTAGIVGCSGTGSPVIEQLVRLGVGKIIIVDPDVIEEKNLNRILNSTINDARRKVPKVIALSNAINKMGLGTKVVSCQTNLYDDVGTLRHLIGCDIIFGCMDSVDGRHLLNQLCSFYLIPYFDTGVKLEADGHGGIQKICGSVHYIQPFKSSLLTRGVYTVEDLRASSQYRRNPEEFKNLKKNSYIKNVNVNSPAVISVNMQIASHAINDLLNRIHPFKSEEPSCYASSTIDITEGYIVNTSEADFEPDFFLKKYAGRGDVVPFILMPELQV